jgi:hypothetical protein
MLVLVVVVRLLEQRPVVVVGRLAQEVQVQGQ